MELNKLLSTILTSNLILIGFYALYRLFFSRLTFHRLNRFFLIFTLLFALFAPHITFEQHFYKPINTPIEWIETFDDLFIADGETPAVEEHSSIPKVPFWLIIYGLGVILFSIRFVIQLAHIFRIRYANQSQHSGFATKIEIGEKEVPFSFFRWIFIPRGNTDSEILTHEMVHVKQGHTFDLVIMEIVGIVCWFNPFVILFRKSLKTIHEFLADEYSVQKSGALDRYLLLLTSRSEHKVLSRFSNQFTHVSLKKRIQMMTKNKSKQRLSLSYLLLVPAFVITLFLAGDIAIGQEKLPEIDPVPAEETIEQPKMAETPVYPVRKEDITKVIGYGYRIHPVYKVKKLHAAIDFAAETGKDVLASQSGTVIKAETSDSGYGKYIIIDHGNGYQTLYAHFSEIKVKEHQLVKQGEVVGLIGSSGFSTGSHLHFEVRYKGEKIDPATYLPKD